MRSSIIRWLWASFMPALIIASPTSITSEVDHSGRYLEPFKSSIPLKMKEFSSWVSRKACKLNIIEFRTCDRDGSKLYARIRLEGPNQVLLHGTPEFSSPGLAINRNDPLEIKEWNMKETLKVSGEPRDDSIKFSYGKLEWTSWTQEGPAECMLVTDTDWNKNGKSKCPSDSRQFECEFPC